MHRQMQAMLYSDDDPQLETGRVFACCQRYVCWFFQWFWALHGRF